MRTREASLRNTKGRSRGRVRHGPEQFLEGNDLAGIKLLGHFRVPRVIERSPMAEIVL